MKEEFYDPACEDDISRRNKTRLELHLKDPIAALDKALKCVESQYCDVWLRQQGVDEPNNGDLSESRAGDRVISEFGQRHVGSRLCGSKAAMTSDRVVSDLMLPLWEEVFWPFLDAWDSVRIRTTSAQWNVPGRCEQYGELFFFLLTKEPMVLRELVRFGPSTPVEAVKARALVCLHMMAEEDSWRTDSGSSSSSSSSSENNVGNGALFVVGLHGSLPARL